MQKAEKGSIKGEIWREETILTTLHQLIRVHDRRKITNPNQYSTMVENTRNSGQITSEIC